MNTYEKLFYEAPFAYHELDADGVILRVNRAECEMLGYSEERLLNAPVWQFICGEEIDASHAALREKLAGTRPLVPFRRTYVTSDSRHVIVEIHDRVLRDSSGNAVGIRSTLIDITERTRVEEALAESKRWLETILRSIQEAIIAVDGLGVIVHMNPSAESLTGWPADKACGTDLELYFRVSALCVGQLADIPIEALFRRSLLEEWRGTAQLTHCSGSTAQIVIRSSPLRHSGEEIAGFVLAFSPAPQAP